MGISRLPPWFYQPRRKQEKPIGVSTYEADMRIFISWSGALSRDVAAALRDWLPSVVQHAEPWVSSEDVAKGTRWSVELGRELQDSDFGIICVTPANVDRPWLNFETGALSLRFGESRVSPFLLGVGHAAVAGGPLAQFQATLYHAADVARLVRSVNARSKTPLAEGLLEKAVRHWWPNLQAALDPLVARAEAEAEAPKSSTSEAMLAEILELTRAQGAAKLPEAMADAVPITPQLREVPRGGVDINEVTFQLARLRAATSDVVPNRPDTAVMVEVRARILLLVKALGPIVDTALVDSLTQMYTEQFTEAELAKATGRSA